MPPLKLIIAMAGLVFISACGDSASSMSSSGSTSSFSITTSSSGSASGSSVTTPSSGDTSSSSVNHNGANKEITLSGSASLAQLAGDKIEIKDGSVFVNGVSFGSVPPGTEVKYTVNPENRTLFVGTERRSAQK